MINKENLKAAMRVMHAMAEVIRELGSVPSGELYARTCMPVGISLDNYQAAINILKRLGFVTEDNHVLTWVMH